VVHFRFEQRNEDHFAAFRRLEFDREADLAEFAEILHRFEVDDAVARILADGVAERDEFRPVLRPRRVEHQQPGELLLDRETGGHFAGSVGPAGQAPVVAGRILPVAGDEETRNRVAAARVQLVAVVDSLLFQHVDESLTDPHRGRGG